MTKGFWSASNAKPLFNSLVGFALEVGERLLINDEEVIFKGWVDQSQTAIEVKAIADDMLQVKQIRAKEIKSLARSLNGTTTSPPASSEFVDAEPQHSDHVDTDHVDNFEVTPDLEEISEPVKEPEYNAWEVWTYLERQRVNTLKLLNTFQTEWEANRFVREAERSTPASLRVHYEIRPILLDESEIKSADQDSENFYNPNDNQADRQDYADAIDVEIINCNYSKERS